MGGRLDIDVIQEKRTLFEIDDFICQDFGDTIPGHGGFMDRFDCQLLMATFVNVYYSSFIRYVFLGLGNQGYCCQGNHGLFTG